MKVKLFKKEKGEYIHFHTEDFTYGLEVGSYLEIGKEAYAVKEIIKIRGKKIKTFALLKPIDKF
jgi:hypothetical protein